MNKQTVVKKFISLALGLVMVLGLAVPVMAQPTDLPVWDNTTAFHWNHTMVGDVAYFGESIDGEIERAEFSISPVFDTTGTVMRPSFSYTGEQVGYTISPVVYAHAPAVITILQTTATVGWGANVVRIDAPNPALPFDGTRHVLDVTTGIRVPYEYGGYLTREGATYVLSAGIYTMASNWDGSQIFIVVQGDVKDTTTQPPTVPNLNTASNWAHDGITQAFRLGLIPQSLQNNYTANATRAEFSAFAVALYETVTGREIIGRMPFNDTDDINVQKMGYLGVVSGVGDGNFAPNDGITREQAAVMIARLANVIGQPLPQSDPTFADNNQISSWAVEAVGQVQAIGIMGGVGNNNFAPSADYTREQSIVTMLRLFDFLDVGREEFERVHYSEAQTLFFTRSSVTQEILGGVTVQLINENNQVVSEWVTARVPHTLVGIQPGNYTIVTTGAYEDGRVMEMTPVHYTVREYETSWREVELRHIPVT